MSGKGAKGRKSKASQPGVLGNLPSTRPARIGGRREPASPAPAAPPRPKSPPRPRPKPKPPVAAVTPSPSPAETPAVPRTTPPIPAEPPPITRSEPTTASTPSDEKSSSLPKNGTELVTTVVQAAGELAQIGLTVGGQVLKRAVSRLPRP